MSTAAISTCVALKKMLVATDFSDTSTRALEYAGSFARRYDARIEIAHVMSPATAEAHSRPQNPKLLKARLRQLASQVQRGGSESSSFLIEGEIGKSIHDLVLAHEIDMVVVGTHGKGELQRLSLGSGAEQIFREVPCPVLTVGPAVGRVPKREICFRHILYATDFTPESAQAAPLALSLADEYRARLTLVHVIPETVVGLPELERHVEYYRDELRKLTSPEIEQWCRPNLLTEYGLPGDVITDFSREHDVDLIVLGAKRTSAVAHRAFSGTAYNVVSKAECPVLTVRGR